MHRVLGPMLIALLLTSCGGSDELTIDDFLAQYPDAYCGYVYRCCDSVERSFGSQVACREVTLETLKEQLAFRNAATPFATFLPKAGQACIDRLKTEACGTTPTLPTGCAGDAVQPQHSEGDECTYSWECTSSYCAQPQKLVRGSCGKKESSACSGDDRSCASGQYCDGNNCKTQIDVSKPCTRGGECVSGICSPSARVCVSRTEPFCDGK